MGRGIPGYRLGAVVAGVACDPKESKVSFSRSGKDVCSESRNCTKICAPQKSPALILPSAARASADFEPIPQRLREMG